MTRVLSAAALIGLLILTVLSHPMATVAVASVVAALGALELAGLSRHMGIPVSAGFIAPMAAVVCAISALGGVAGPPPRPEMLSVLLLALVVATGVLTLASSPPDTTTLARSAITLMAPLYVGLPLGAIARVRLMYGPRVVGVLAVLIIASDSAQYFVGRAIGRRKLAPQISPGKTVEGALGGLVAGALAGLIVGPRWVPDLGLAGGAVLGGFVSAFGIVGDLFESLLKRGAGVKDSSSLIPGHGGVLDRVDSWLFAGPVYYMLLRYLA